MDCPARRCSRMPFSLRAVYAGFGNSGTSMKVARADLNEQSGFLGRALYAAAGMAFFQGDQVAALERSTTGLAVLRATGSLLWLGYGLCAMAHSLETNGERSRAVPYYEEMAAIGRIIGK